MKKTISTAITLLAFFMSNAQIQRGATALGFNLAATYNVAKSSSPSSNFEFTTTTKVLAAQPLAEFFVNKNLSFGIGLNLSALIRDQKLEFGNNLNENNNSTYSYGLQVQLKRYWFATKKIAFTFTPAIAASFNENSFVQKDNFGGISFKGNSEFWGFSFGGNLGAGYLLKPNLMLEAQTNFYTYYYSQEESNKVNNYVISLVPNNLTLGFKFIFGNKAKNVKVD
ncbi:MAG: hypothetical protein ACEQSR_11090 [Candidatus Methylacidiphilales bacterium]